MISLGFLRCVWRLPCFEIVDFQFKRVLSEVSLTRRFRKIWRIWFCWFGFCFVFHLWFEWIDVDRVHFVWKRMSAQQRSISLRLSWSEEQSYLWALNLWTRMSHSWKKLVSSVWRNSALEPCLVQSYLFVFESRMKGKIKKGCKLKHEWTHSLPVVSTDGTAVGACSLYFDPCMTITRQLPWCERASDIGGLLFSVRRLCPLLLLGVFSPLKESSIQIPACLESSRLFLPERRCLTDAWDWWTTGKYSVAAFNSIGNAHCLCLLSDDRNITDMICWCVAVRVLQQYFWSLSSTSKERHTNFIWSPTDGSLTSRKDWLFEQIRRGIPHGQQSLSFSVHIGIHNNLQPRCRSIPWHSKRVREVTTVDVGIWMRMSLKIDPCAIGS